MAEKDELLESNYDGIQEYDNDLPQWWLALFWGGIVFGFIYVGLFHFGGWQFTSQRLEVEMAELRETQEAMKPKVDENSLKDTLLALVSNEEQVAAGKALFVKNCAACHMAEGQGLVGPNLTDDYWIHGGEIVDIHRVIVEGVTEKGMIPWGPVLTKDEINQLAAFVWTLNGTSPPNPKEPQGDLVKRES